MSSQLLKINELIYFSRREVLCLSAGLSMREWVVRKLKEKIPVPPEFEGVGEVLENSYFRPKALFDHPANPWPLSAGASSKTSVVSMGMECLANISILEGP